MRNVQQSPNFSVTQAAARHVNFLHSEYLKRSPDDPPVLVGLFTARSLTEKGIGLKQIGVGFWRKSEVSERAWAEENIVEIAGFKALVGLPQADLLLLRSGVIDFSLEEGLFIRAVKPE
jgi:hypothetical protein